MKKGNIIILSGPSGVGKGTVRDELFKIDALNMSFSISMTTRSPRVGEVDGVHYFFKTVDEFKENIEKGNFIEWAQFSGNYYGTPKHYVEQLVNEGKNVLLEIEVQGALQVIEKIPEALSIFILPPSMEELEKRLRGRGTESEEAIQRRLAQVEREMSVKDHYKYNVINDTVEQCVNDISKIIEQNMI